MTSVLPNRSPRAEALRHVLIPLVAAVAVAVVVIVIWQTARPSAVPAHTIAVVRFENQTGLADYDRYAQDVTDALVGELTRGKL